MLTLDRHAKITHNILGDFMSLIPSPGVSLSLSDVNGITHEQKKLIHSFLQGSVYCWCKNRPDEWFALRDLVGGDNYDWLGTPLFVLYEKHQSKNDAVLEAGIDAGWLLKTVLHNDQRAFDIKREYVNKYKWNKNN